MGPNFVIKRHGRSTLLDILGDDISLPPPGKQGQDAKLIVNPIDDVEKLPCMTNDRSNSMPLNQRLFHRPHILVRSTLLF